MGTGVPIGSGNRWTNWRGIAERLKRAPALRNHCIPCFSGPGFGGRTSPQGLYSVRERRLPLQNVHRTFEVQRTVGRAEVRCIYPMRCTFRVLDGFFSYLPAGEGFGGVGAVSIGRFVLIKGEGGGLHFGDTDVGGVAAVVGQGLGEDD